MQRGCFGSIASLIPGLADACNQLNPGSRRQTASTSITGDVQSVVEASVNMEMLEERAFPGPPSSFFSFKSL